MKTKQVGQFSKRFYFSLSEESLYNEYKQHFAGYYNIIYINNGYCLEVTKRSFKLA